MPQLIRLTGIRAEGRHGAADDERQRPQPFVVDLEVVVEAETDSLSSTADYRDVAAAVRDVIGGASLVLVETLAMAVARRVAAVPGVMSCRAVVHKPAASDRLGIGDISAEATAREQDR
ncbi:MAG TPA: dihydroneopterin aldolase [Actinomycetota bacterium]|jgi:dihydroneopterin aldolase|nr:dihydroneopterin aldolase [Actinomycetota bacterium]